MLRITLRFYGDLNDLLFRNFTGPTVDRRLPAPTSVKDLVEGCGVPHTEVEYLLADGRPVDLSYLVRKNQRVVVYPFFNNIDLPENERLQNSQLSTDRFLADANLGKLARYLRLAGFDTAYHREGSDREIIRQMVEEERILLSRDRKLLMHKEVEHGYLPRSDDPARQLKEVLHRFDFFSRVKPFTRCSRCNGILQHVSKEEITGQLEPLTKLHFNRFSQCTGCGQIYWAGSHLQRLSSELREIFED